MNRLPSGSIYTSQLYLLIPHPLFLFTFIITAHVIVIPTSTINVGRITYWCSTLPFLSEIRRMLHLRLINISPLKRRRRVIFRAQIGSWLQYIFCCALDEQISARRSLTVSGHVLKPQADHTDASWDGSQYRKFRSNIWVHGIWYLIWPLSVLFLFIYFCPVINTSVPWRSGLSA